MAYDDMRTPSGHHLAAIARRHWRKHSVCVRCGQLRVLRHIVKTRIVKNHAANNGGVGGGDSFASGILHGVLQENWEPQQIVDFATGSSVLKHMVYGDSNQFDEAYVLQFVENQDNDVKR